MLNRRHMLKALGATGLMPGLGAVRFAHAATPGDQRLVLIILRGAMDGLHALPPYADDDYRRLRPRLAIGAPGTADGAIDLDGYFGLHPSLGPLHDLYTNGELLFIPASTTRYGDRSHFDGQNVLENGTAVPYGARDGWLNRALVGLDAAAPAGDRRLGLSIGPAVPLILQGEAAVTTWSDSSLPEPSEDFLSRVGRLYDGDPVFARAFKEANEGLEVSQTMMMTDGGNGASRAFLTGMNAAADLLAQADGPRIAVVESGGWDTHFGQVARLRLLFQDLAGSIIAMRQRLGTDWGRTTLLVVSEFGRTAAENGSAGTDHGVGGLAILAGGTVRGGRIGGDWPGLSSGALNEGRDVRATTDYEAIFKAVLTGPLGLDNGYVDRKVFPDAHDIRPMPGLFA